MNFLSLFPCVVTDFWFFDFSLILVPSLELLPIKSLEVLEVMVFVDIWLIGKRIVWFNASSLSSQDYIIGYGMIYGVFRGYFETLARWGNSDPGFEFNDPKNVLYIWSNTQTRAYIFFLCGAVQFFKIYLSVFLCKRFYIKLFCNFFCIPCSLYMYMCVYFYV